MVFVLGFGSGVGTAPDLGNHFLLRQKVIKNRFSIPTVKLTSRCALRSDSHRESEFLWGSALRFARACLLRLGCVLFRLPAACFGLWFFYFLGWPLVYGGLLLVLSCVRRFLISMMNVRHTLFELVSPG